MSGTSLRIVVISAFAALSVGTIGISAASALPLNTSSIGAAAAESSLLTKADFYIENGRCYMRIRLTSRPMPMSKCAAVQRHPPAH